MSGYAERLDKASRVADRQGVTLRRSNLQIGGAEDTRFDMTYQRYDQPVGYYFTLTQVEIWLGIRRSP